MYPIKGRQREYEMITTTRAAELLGISTRRVRALTASGIDGAPKLRSSKLGRDRFVNTDDVIGRVKSLDDLLAILKALNEEETAHVDMTDLPSFGGEEPDDTAGVWSWDEKRELVGDGRSDLCIDVRS